MIAAAMTPTSGTLAPGTAMWTMLRTHIYETEKPSCGSYRGWVEWAPVHEQAQIVGWGARCWLCLNVGIMQSKAMVQCGVVHLKYESEARTAMRVIEDKKGLQREEGPLDYVIYASQASEPSIQPFQDSESLCRKILHSPQLVEKEQFPISPTTISRPSRLLMRTSV